MNKNIYSGPLNGNPFGNFDSLMRRIKDVEIVNNLNYKADPDVETGVDKQLAVYHLNGVTITYFERDYRDTPIINIHLVGSEYAITKVEKRLIKAKQKISKLEEMARKTKDDAINTKF